MNDRVTDKLYSKEQIEEWADQRADDAGRLSRQLLDAMRENERLREALERPCIKLNVDGEKKYFYEAGWKEALAMAKIHAGISKEDFRKMDENTDSVSEPKCKENDGCPTEGAVLKRFWRKYQWQPMETAPRSETILLHDVYGQIGIGQIYPSEVGEQINAEGSGWAVTGGYYYSSHKFTHWMSLPQHPNKEPAHE